MPANYLSATCLTPAKGQPAQAAIRLRIFCLSESRSLLNHRFRGFHGQKAASVNLRAIWGPEEHSNDLWLSSRGPRRASGKVGRSAPRYAGEAYAVQQGTVITAVLTGSHRRSHRPPTTTNQLPQTIRRNWQRRNALRGKRGHVTGNLLRPASEGGRGSHPKFLRPPDREELCRPGRSQSWPVHEWGVYLAFTPDGQSLVLGQWTSGFCVLDLHSMRQRYPPIPSATTVYGTAISGNSSRIALTELQTGVSRVFDLSTGRQIGRGMQHSVSSQAIALNADGTLLVTGSMEGTVRLWDVGTSQPLGPPLAHR